MAILSKSSPLHGATGVVGDLLLRNINGQTIVSQHVPPKKRHKISALQQLYRDKFAKGTQYAKEALRDIDLYEYYKRKAKKLGVGSAYTAAVTDYMRTGQIDAVDTSKFERKGQVVVKVRKQDLDIADVKLRVTTRDGEVLTEATGKRQTNGTWQFLYPGTPPRLSDVRLYVEARDRVGHSVYREAA